FCDVNLQPLTVFVGRNAAGKSNFLDALAFLRDAMQTSASEAVMRRGGWPSVACRATNAQTIDFEIEAFFPSDHPQVATYRFELSAENNAAPIITTEFVEIAARTTALVEAGFQVSNGIIKDWRSKPAPVEGEIDIPHPYHLFKIYRDRLFLSVLGTQPFV